MFIGFEQINRSVVTVKTQSCRTQTMRDTALTVVARVAQHPRLVTTLLIICLLLVGTGGAAAVEGDFGTTDVGTGDGGPTTKD